MQDRVGYAFGGTPVSGPPAVLFNRPGTVVVFKPAGWEVDSTGGGDDRMLLSSFLQHEFSKELNPLVHLLEFGYGFLHRLDLPSSGLVLAGTTFEGLYSLRGQLNTYCLAREYATLCHHVAPPSLDVDARVDATSTRVLRSAVGDLGRPASSRLLAPAHLRRAGPPLAALCLLVVRIRTGRRHQIRVHTRHVGHPTVADCWYCPEACTLDGGY
uniref:Pseudouridine synthase RsuA/RluA-like domain-containing protein n=1 Tax=Pyrodinium bahamense TaxID=73915 RepID=A0A7S0BA90_9DINO|mmetsp:Transcript_7405/g.20530  ORF Transcript_7405/g.20530 Transcript_7405/m.20530 type:complete len:213 (+) Transcript_7405:554-1192(+)